MHKCGSKIVHGGTQSPKQEKGEKIPALPRFHSTTVGFLFQLSPHDFYDMCNVFCHFGGVFNIAFLCKGFKHSESLTSLIFLFVGAS